MILVAVLLILSQAVTPEERQRNVDAFDSMWTTVRDKHWDPKLGGLDWEAIRAELRPQVEQARTTAEARVAMRTALARLGQSHFSILPADLSRELAGGSREDGDTGIDAGLVEGKALVTVVEPGSPAAAQGVKPGWEIVKARGTDVSAVMTRILESGGAVPQRELLLRGLVFSRLAGKPGETVRVEFLDGNGGKRELDIGRAPARGQRTGFGFLPPRNVWIETRKLAGEIGYIRFNMFLDAGNMMPKFEELIRSCLDCRGVVIDLRGNPGGLVPMAMGMAGWFIEESGRQLGVMYQRALSLKCIVNPRPVTFRGPLAVLVDGGSASTAEILAGGLKDLGRARIFGTRTAGAALPSTIDRLPNGDGFQYAIGNYISEGGKALEGAGVTPDVEVAHTRAALLAGKDRVLDSALDWIHAQPKKSGN